MNLASLETWGLLEASPRLELYDHNDHDELRKAYLAAIPMLGVI